MKLRENVKNLEIEIIKKRLEEDLIKLIKGAIDGDLGKYNYVNLVKEFEAFNKSTTLDQLPSDNLVITTFLNSKIGLKFATKYDVYFFAKQEYQKLKAIVDSYKTEFAQSLKKTKQPKIENVSTTIKENFATLFAESLKLVPSEYLRQYLTECKVFKKMKNFKTFKNQIGSSKNILLNEIDEISKNIGLPIETIFEEVKKIINTIIAQISYRIDVEKQQEKLSQHIKITVHKREKEPERKKSSDLNEINGLIKHVGLKILNEKNNANKKMNDPNYNTDELHNFVNNLEEARTKITENIVNKINQLTFDEVKIKLKPIIQNLFGFGGLAEFDLI